MILKINCLLIISLVAASDGLCQGPPVVWNFTADSVRRGKAVIVLSAKVADGWKIYSQQMNEGGPLPTRFYFDSIKGLLLEGVTREKGDLERSYNSLYGMEVAWYYNHVTFSQSVKFDRELIVSGFVQYLACNDEVCVPEKQRFFVRLSNLP